MVKKGYTTKQIINKLREAEILLNQGNTLAVSLEEDWCHRTDLLPLAQRIWRQRGEQHVTGCPGREMGCICLDYVYNLHPGDVH